MMQIKTFKGELETMEAEMNKLLLTEKLRFHCVCGPAQTADGLFTLLLVYFMDKENTEEEREAEAAAKALADAENTPE